MEDWSRDGGVKVQGALSSGYGKKFWVKDRHGDNDETYHELLALAVADHGVCSSPGKDQVHNINTDFKQIQVISNFLSFPKIKTGIYNLFFAKFHKGLNYETEERLT